MEFSASSLFSSGGFSPHIDHGILLGIQECAALKSGISELFVWGRRGAAAAGSFLIHGLGERAAGIPLERREASIPSELPQKPAGSSAGSSDPMDPPGLSQPLGCGCGAGATRGGDSAAIPKTGTNLERAEPRGAVPASGGSSRIQALGRGSRGHPGAAGSCRELPGAPAPGSVLACSPGLSAVENHRERSCQTPGAGVSLG